MTNSSPKVLYLHGFKSSDQSMKGLYFKGVLEEMGFTVLNPDLNIPSFAKLSYRAILDYLSGVVASDSGQWIVIGSSMGGYLTASLAKAFPEKITKAVMFCPGFEMSKRWPNLFGEQALKLWEQQGYLELPDWKNDIHKVHYQLIEEASEIDPAPEFTSPAIIIHGRQDTVVPIGTSRSYADRNDNVTLFEVDDDHYLANSLEFIKAKLVNFLADEI